MDTQKSLIDSVLGNSGMIKLLGISKSKFYRLLKDKYLSKTLANRRKILVRGILNEQITSLEQLEDLTKLLLLPFSECSYDAIEEIEQIIERSTDDKLLFGFLRAPQHKENLRSILTVTNERSDNDGT